MASGGAGRVLAFAVFFGGAAGLRSYITFIVHQSHAYGTLAGPIAALLFLFVLALGVLFGAEFNAAIEYMWPSRERRPRALHPRRWIRLEKDTAVVGPGADRAIRRPALAFRPNCSTC